MDKDSELWLTVVLARNQTDRTKAYNIWHRFRFPYLYPQKEKVAFT